MPSSGLDAFIGVGCLHRDWMPLLGIGCLHRGWMPSSGVGCLHRGLDAFVGDWMPLSGIGCLCRGLDAFVGLILSAQLAFANNFVWYLK